MIWFHLYCVNHWYDVATEMLRAIRRAEFTERVCMHVVGSSSDAISLEDLAGRLGLLNWSVTVHNSNTFEYHTLESLWRYSQDHDGPIGYIHSKGVTNPSPASTKWRWMMIAQIITEWRGRVRDLDEFDAVGCCYRTDRAYFAGNWWWARAEWLRMLPEPVIKNDRFYYEHWLLSRLGAKTKSLISTGGEPCEEPYYVSHGNPHLRFVERILSEID